MRFLLLAGVILTVNFVKQDQKIDSVQSVVNFEVASTGSLATTEGSFNGIHGDILFDSGSIEQSFFDVWIDASTINTGINLRDNHLKSDDFFDVEKYPRITFVSSAISKKDEGYVTTGLLKIKDIEKSVDIPFESDYDNNTITLQGKLQVQRKEFELGTGFGKFFIGEEVDVSIRCIILKQEYSHDLK